MSLHTWQAAIARYPWSPFFDTHSKIKKSEVRQMNFNYGYERRIFEKKQAELREIYLAAGMSEEAI